MVALSPEQKKALILQGAARALEKKGERPKPDFFRDFLPHVQIRSDEGNLIPFEAYDYQLDMFRDWLEGESEVCLKGRQIGISWCSAIYKLYRAAVDGWAVGYISYKQDFSRDHLRNRVRLIWDRLPNVIELQDGRRWKKPGCRWTADQAEFVTGGSILAFPSTPDAGVGYTFQLLVPDELAFHEYARQNLEALFPTLPPGSQMIAFSTSDPSLGPHGAFYDLWQTAEKRGYRKRFLPWNVRPEHDSEAYEREKLKYAQSEREFRAFHPLSENEAFEGKSGLVFPQFVNGYPHVQEPSCDWSEYKFRVAGIDPGGGDPTAIVPLGITHDWVFEQPYEFYKRGPVTLDEMFDWLWDLHGRGPFDYIWVDAGRKSPMVAQLYWRGLPVFGANKDKAARLSLHAWALEQRRLRISPKCVDSIAEYSGYMFPEHTDPNTKEKYRTSTPVDHHADACFVAGTLIATERGQIPIEEVQVGERVWTRSGLRRVLESGATGEKPVWQLDSTQGSLVGTGNHPVYVAGQGFTRLDALGYGDILEPCNASTEPTTQRLAVVGAGTKRSGATVPQCIEMCGSTTTAQSRMAGTCITSTETPTIMTSPTWSQSRPMSITPTTQHMTGGSPAKPLLPLLSGIAPPMGGNGTGNMPSAFGNNDRSLASLVNTVASSSMPSSPRPSSVPRSARPPLDERPASMMYSDHVPFAGAPSLATAIPESVHAPVVVQAKSLQQSALVYNLTVEGDPEYYANGLLVHNCDARGYAMLGAMEAIRRGSTPASPSITFNRNNSITSREPEQRSITFARRG